MSFLAAAVNAWQLELHPEVWLLVVTIVALGVYSVRVIGPLAVAPGQPVVTRNQKLFFVAGVGLLWLAADWPMHDIAEKYLYSVHMVQHLLISFMVPPLLLMAMPEWLARLIVLDDSRSARVLRILTRPVVAGVIFNVVQVFTHWGTAVDLSIENGAFHYGVHLLVFASALLMWFPVVGPLKELQMSEPGKMLYLFLMSIIPTVPAAWLTFAEDPVYPGYDHDQRLWGISVITDQQAAGAIMKVLGGTYLWLLIAVRFFRYSAQQREADHLARRRRHSDSDLPLTVADVEAVFELAGDPRHEHVPGD
jgi:putative membrane protein